MRSWALRRAGKDRGWMILQRGGLQLEFFPYPDLDPATSSFGCCLRLDDLDAMVALVNAAGAEEKHRLAALQSSATGGERPEDRLPDRSRLHAGAADPEPRLTACPRKSRFAGSAHPRRSMRRGAARADYAGLVFYPASPRAVTSNVAGADIARSWPDRHGRFVRRCG